MYVYNSSVRAVNQWWMSTGIYCLTNKTGRPTQLEKIVEDLLEEEVNGNIYSMQEVQGPTTAWRKQKYKMYEY